MMMMIMMMIQLQKSYVINFYDILRIKKNWTHELSICAMNFDNILCQYKYSERFTFSE